MYCRQTNRTCTSRFPPISLDGVFYSAGDPTLGHAQFVWRDGMEWIKPIGSGHRLPLQSAEFGGIFASAASATVRAPVPQVFGGLSELC